MNEKEKIRNELMLRLTNYKETLNVSGNSALNLSLKSKIDEEESLLSFIDSLSKQPTSVSLDEELKRYLSEYYNYNYPKQYIEGTGASCMPHLVEVAKHFAEWQKEQIITKACEWMENNLCCYVGAQDFTIEHKRLEKDFRKAMEG